MKCRIIFFIFFALFIIVVSSCNVQNSNNTVVDKNKLNVSNSQYYNSRIINTFSNILPNGEIYEMQNGQLAFFDFDSMQSAVICSNPNCKHDNPNECTSFGMSCFPILYEESIYYFMHTVEYDINNAPTYITKLFKANVDGTQRKEICSFKGYDINTLSVFLSNNLLYLSLEQATWEGYIQTNYSKHFLYCYNLCTNQYREISIICEGYNSGVKIFGEYDNKIYFVSSYTKENQKRNISYDDFEFNYYYYDVINDEVQISNLPEPIDVEQGYYIYNDIDGTVIMDKEGKHLIKNLHIDRATVVNNIIFFSGNGICYDTTNQKLYKLKQVRDAVLFDVISYIDDRYILRQYKYTGNNSEVIRGYSSLTKDQLIEGETFEYTIT